MPIHKIDYQNYITPSDYIKFDQGETKIRIVSAGGMCLMHGMRTARGYVNMGMCAENDTCEQCKKGNEAKQRWMWIVFLPKYRVVRLMETGKKLGDSICKLALKVDDIQNYELIVTRTGEMLKTEYSIALGEKTILGESDKEFVLPSKNLLVKKYFK